MARGASPGRSSSASSGPIGPGISRTTSANSSPCLSGHGQWLQELGEHADELLRTGDQSQVASPCERQARRLWPQFQVFTRARRRYHVIKLVLARDDERLHIQTTQLRI